jgi:hypothetical protein
VVEKSQKSHFSKPFSSTTSTDRNGSKTKFTLMLNQLNLPHPIPHLIPHPSPHPSSLIPHPSVLWFYESGIFFLLYLYYLLIWRGSFVFHLTFLY